jgi:hypothetical protein
MAQSLKAMQPSSQVDAMPRLRLQFLNILIRISFLSPFTTYTALILAAQIGLGVLTVHCHPELDVDVDPSFERLGLEELLEGSSVVTSIRFHFLPLPRKYLIRECFTNLSNAMSGAFGVSAKPLGQQP